MDHPSQMQNPPPATPALSNTTNLTYACSCGGPDLSKYHPVTHLKPLPTSTHKKLNIMTAGDINRSGMAMIYMSPDPFFEAFEQLIDLRDFNLNNHPTAGLSLYECNGRQFLATMSPSTPAAKIPDWRPRVRGACLIKVGQTMVNTIDNIATAFQNLHTSSNLTLVLLFAHPEIRPNLSHDGLPIVLSASFTQSTHDQLNNRWEFSTVADHLHTSGPQHQLIASRDVLNFINCAICLTRGKLLKQLNWKE